MFSSDAQRNHHAIRTILIIDDDADIRAIVCRIFSVQGYRVIEATDGVSAFTVARRCSPDLIFLDLGLPGHDGWTVVRELRAEPALDQVPILVITGNVSSGAYRFAREVGCQALISKPFALETLEDLVDDFLHPYDSPLQPLAAARGFVLPSSEVP